MVAPAGGSDETVSYTIKINAADAKKALEDIVKSLDTADEKIRRLQQLILTWSNLTGNSTSKVAAAFKILAAEMGTVPPKLVATANGLIKVDQALTPLPPKLAAAANAAGEGPTGFAGMLGKLGSVGSFVFGSVLGVTAISVLRNVIDFFGQATAAGLKYNQTLFEFEAGVRAIQRAGLDITMKEAKDEIEALRLKYPLFSKQSLMEGYGQIQLLTRGLHLTRQELDQLIEVSITASTILGRDFGETAAGIAKSLSSGWFEAAQRAGFLISRQSVVDEGLRMNIENAKNGYNAMTQYERALASLSTYVKENKTLQADVTKIMETQAGKVLTAQANWENLKLAVGQVIAPMKAIGAERLSPLLVTLEHVAEGWLTIVTVMIATQDVMRQFGAYAVDIFKRIEDKTPFGVFRKAASLLLEDIVNLGKAIYVVVRTVVLLGEIAYETLSGIIPDETIKKASFLANIFTRIGEIFKQKETGKGLSPEIFDFSDVWQQAIDDAARFTGVKDLLGDIGDEHGEAYLDGLEGGLDNVGDTFEKLRYNIEDELTKLTNRIVDIGIDLQRKLAEINRDYYTDLRRTNEDYANDVEETNISFNNRRAEAERKYRIAEIDAEAKFQEAMRQLRTKFLFDLEDALRERDARQVLRLVRQYQMDKENMTREEDLAREQRRRQHEEELRDLEAQRAERLRILAEEHALELRRMWENWQQKQADAFARRQQEIEDAQKASEERIKQMELDFQREYGLTEAQARELVSMLQAYFGTNGPVAQLYENLYNYIMQLVALTNAALGSIGSFGTQAPGTIPGSATPVPAGTHAQGGTFVARKPTLAIYGDAGAERATFTPLNRSNASNNDIFSTNGGGGSSALSGNISVIVELSPDLEGRIVDETLYNVSAVVKEVTRQR